MDTIDTKHIFGLLFTVGPHSMADSIFFTLKNIEYEVAYQMTLKSCLKRLFFRNIFM